MIEIKSSYRYSNAWANACTNNLKCCTFKYVRISYSLKHFHMINATLLCSTTRVTIDNRLIAT